MPFEKYDALVQLVAQMKREGFTVTGQPEQPAEQRTLPKDVLVAIREVSPDSRTERHLVAQAWDMIEREMPEEAIVEQIKRGEPVDL